MKKHLILCSLFFVVMGLLAGCCGGGGGGSTKVEAPTYTTTVGDQMVDLQKAYESGAITESQYKKAKQDILDGIKK